jgi:hypothetical protein
VRGKAARDAARVELPGPSSTRRLRHLARQRHETTVHLLSLRKASARYALELAVYRLEILFGMLANLDSIGHDKWSPPYDRAGSLGPGERLGHDLARVGWLSGTVQAGFWGPVREGGPAFQVLARLDAREGGRVRAGRPGADSPVMIYGLNLHHSWLQASFPGSVVSCACVIRKCDLGCARRARYATLGLGRYMSSLSYWGRSGR